MQMTLAIYMVY